MKSTLAVLVGLFAASISAAPLDPTSTYVTVSLINDLSGKNAAITVPADGTDRSISGIFGNSPLAVNGQILASSAQLIGFPQGVSCTIVNSGKTVGSLDSQKTFADLDGNAAAAVPQNLNAAVLNCKI